MRLSKKLLNFCLKKLRVTLLEAGKNNTGICDMELPGTCIVWKRGSRDEYS